MRTLVAVEMSKRHQLPCEENVIVVTKPDKKQVPSQILEEGAQSRDNNRRQREIVPSSVIKGRIIWMRNLSFN